MTAALDHNLLLPVYLVALALAVGAYVLPLTGRAAPTVRFPRAVLPAAVAVLVVFTVARNLPGFDYLAA